MAAKLAAPTGGGLATRVVTGLALAVVALGAVWLGGLAFTALAALGGLLMFAEWSAMHGVGRRMRLVGLMLIAATCALTSIGQATYAWVVCLAGAGMLWLAAKSYDWRAAFWSATGVLYCALPAAALILLRSDPKGLKLTIWTLLIVWATDIFAYFAGRAIGGPKLMPLVSPKKTWAGLGGGVLGAAATSYAMARFLELSNPVVMYATIAATGLAVVAQAGDLFESWLKRRAGVKDSGGLLPGHGGVLDRLDGLVPVAIIVVAALLYYGPRLAAT